MKKYLLKRYLWFLVLSFSLFAPALPKLNAQTAERLTWLLEQEMISYRQVSWFVLEAADIGERFGPWTVVSPEAAFDFAMEQGWLPRNVRAEHAVRMMGLSFMIMQVFEIRGGIFYTLTRSQRHAYRELAYLGIIQGRSDPAMLVTGDQLLFTVNRALHVLGRE